MQIGSLTRRSVKKMVKKFLCAGWQSVHLALTPKWSSQIRNPVPVHLVFWLYIPGSIFLALYYDHLGCNNQIEITFTRNSCPFNFNSKLFLFTRLYFSPPWRSDLVLLRWSNGCERCEPQVRLFCRDKGFFFFTILFPARSSGLVAIVLECWHSRSRFLQQKRYSSTLPWQIILAVYF